MLGTLWTALKMVWTAWIFLNGLKAEHRGKVFCKSSQRAKRFFKESKVLKSEKHEIIFRDTRWQLDIL